MAHKTKVKGSWHTSGKRGISMIASRTHHIFISNFSVDDFYIYERLNAADYETERQLAR